MQDSTIRLTGPLDPRPGWVAENCPIDRALAVVGTRSALLLLREAFYGTTRFADFAERAGSASRWPPSGCASSPSRA